MDQAIQHFKSISHLLHEMGLAAPSHPLVAIIDYSKEPIPVLAEGIKLTLDFYKVSFKKTFSGQVKYGQGHYDFQEGGLAFLKPGQVVATPVSNESYEGYVLYFHTDLIRNYSLGKQISQYGFFSYAVSEALFLSAREKEIIQHVFAGISQELQNNIDAYSQDVLVSQLELLLNHCNRFYNRQFITRKIQHSESLGLIEQLLDDYFINDSGLQQGLPSVKYVSDKLGLSQRYLSDMLKSLTGKNTQQYIQERVIERSKDLLSATSLTVAEVAFRLGFEHPQSFSKLFKAKTNLSPLEFRQSFN